MILVLAGASAETVIAVAALVLGVGGYAAGTLWAATTVLTLALQLRRLYRAEIAQERLRSELERDHAALRQSQRDKKRPSPEITGKK